MQPVIKDGVLVDDRWTLLRDASTVADVVPGAPAILPLALWLRHRDDLLARGDIGVWLAPDDDPEALGGDIGRLPLIAVDFPQFTDGRGYSIGRLLRDRHRFAGELRAVGDVLRDQLFALAECGFDAFALDADRDAAGALSGFGDFTGVYAPTSRTPQPWFRRRQAPTGSAEGEIAVG
jgi:uncharacterized protein (DUF934 family)